MSDKKLFRAEYRGVIWLLAENEEAARSELKECIVDDAESGCYYATLQTGMTACTDTGWPDTLPYCVDTDDVRTVQQRIDADEEVTDGK